MAKSIEETGLTNRRKARTPDQRQNQLIALAVDQVEKRLINGEASAAELVYFLKLASPAYQLEVENLRLQGELLRAKRDEIASNQKGNADYAKAMEMFSGYQGSKDEIMDAEYKEI